MAAEGEPYVSPYLQDYELVDEVMNYVGTQYRESTNMLHLMRTYLRQGEIVYQVLEQMLDYFNLDTAVGDQLTLIGKRLGWPREHCICLPQTLFGFDCMGITSKYTLSGFCDTASTWEDCGTIVNGTITIEDDEIYRKFLQVRCYQIQQRYALEDLEACCDILWGVEASVLAAKRGRIVIAIGRDLTEEEGSLLQLYPRVLPVALGIKVYFHLNNVPVFGFGDGWEGVCEIESSPLLLVDENGDHLQDESGNNIDLYNTYRGGEWMCEFDPTPYNCHEPLDSIL